MEALGKRRFQNARTQPRASMKRRTRCADRTLEPRPGRDFLPDNQHVLPEVFVQKVGDDFW
jgi:hypothetical protein